MLLVRVVTVVVAAVAAAGRPTRTATGPGPRGACRRRSGCSGLCGLRAALPVLGAERGALRHERQQQRLRGLKFAARLGLALRRER